MATEIQIGGLVLQPDTCQVATIAHSAEATSYPIEGGASRSDHVVVRPMTLEMVAIFSEQPLDPATRTPAPGPERPEAARFLLTQALQQRKTVTVAGHDTETFADLVLTSISSSRTSDTGSALAIRMSLQQIVSVEARTVEIPPARRAPSIRPAAPTVDLGTFATSDAPAAVAARAAITGSIAGYLTLTGQPGAAPAIRRLLGVVSGG